LNFPVTAERESSSASSQRPSPFLLALALIAVLLIWSFNFVAAKIGLQHMDATSFISIRMPLAALLMLPIFFAQPRRTLLDRRDIWMFMCLGFFGVVINSGCFVLGLTQTTSEHSVIVRALGPVLVLALAVALAVEKVTPAKAAGMLISFLGVILLDNGHGVSMHSALVLGDLYTFLSIAGYAIYTVCAKRIAMRYDAVAMNTYTVVAAGLMAAPVALRQAIHLQWGSVGWMGWAAMLYMAAVTTVASYTIYSWVLRYMEPSRVAVVNYVQPVVVILISIPLLGEHPTQHLLGGGLLVLIGVYLAERAK
jgi:drug/metabolite transporter (DMT)-like permease